MSEMMSGQSAAPKGPFWLLPALRVQCMTVFFLAVSVWSCLSVPCSSGPCSGDVDFEWSYCARCRDDQKGNV